MRMSKIHKLINNQLTTNVITESDNWNKFFNSTVKEIKIQMSAIILFFF